MKRSIIRGMAAAAGLLTLLAVAGCGGAPQATQSASAAPAPTAASAPAAPAYTPKTRDFTVTTVPLVVHEMQGAMDFLKEDFAKGGILDGKEVYGFYPSTLTVYAGDTVNLTLVNPEDDPHTFTIADLNVNVNMPGQKSVKTSFTASKPGVYSFVCAEPEHYPYMWGQLVVLPDSAAS